MGSPTDSGQGIWLRTVTSPTGGQPAFHCAEGLGHCRVHLFMSLGSPPQGGGGGDSVGPRTPTTPSPPRAPNLSLVLTLHLPLPLALTPTKIEYWGRAGGGRNIVQENSTTNEVRIGKWMRAAQKGLKMSCIHPFGHHNWTRIIFGKP